ncbi:MAG: peptidase C1, partial [Thermotogaceae bacterium]|nr:peptidase C1 [Thermotogaceae bacterium]
MKKTFIVLFTVMLISSFALANIATQVRSAEEEINSSIAELNLSWKAGLEDSFVAKLETANISDVGAIFERLNGYIDLPKDVSNRLVEYLRMAYIEEVEDFSIQGM